MDERSHWIKDNISNPNLNNSILLKKSVIVTLIMIFIEETFHKSLVFKKDLYAKNLSYIK